MSVDNYRTQYGFRYGPMNVSRIIGGQRAQACIGIATKWGTVLVWCTKTGILHVEGPVKAEKKKGKKN